MADDDFFKDSAEAPEVPEESGIEKVEKFKIGEREYSQEDLDKVVGLGELARELEDKWSTKIDKLMPEYTKKTQEVAELKKQLDSSKVSEVEKKVASGQELTPEEVEAQVRAEAKKYGIVTKAELDEYFEQKYTERRAGERLFESVDSLIKEADSVGKPKTNAADLLEFMQEKGFRDPNDAYEIMFKNELRDWERKQLADTRQSGLITESRSTAGSKQPAPVKVTKDNLESLVLAEMNKGAGN